MKRKTRKEKIQRKDRVEKAQIEYAKLLKQKTDLRAYKEALMVHQESIRKNFFLLELGMACVLAGTFYSTKTLNENRIHTKYQGKEITFDLDGWASHDLGYMEKNTSLEEPTFYYQSNWTVPQNSPFAYRMNITIPNKKKLYAYLEMMQEQNKIELPSMEFADWSLETTLVEEVDLEQPSEFYGAYQYLDETEKIEIPVSEEEKKDFEINVAWFLILLEGIATPYAYQIGRMSHYLETKELKNKIRKLEKSPE